MIVGFSKPSSGSCTCTPAYLTGDRSSSITVTTDIVGGVGTVHPDLVNGNTADDTGFYLPLSYAVTGRYIRFDFGASNSIKITEATRYMSASATTWATWKWQGSDDASSWTDIGSSFVITGGSNPIDDLSANALGYRYYQLVGVSGTGTAGSRASMDELEFKQCTC